MKKEFEFLDNIKSMYRLSKIGDDCAVLPKDDETDLVLTVDMLVEDIDFRLEWATPEDLGHKVFAVSLSDVAAMGAFPKWAMLSIAIAEDLWKTDFLNRFYDGWHQLAREYSVELVGGDISRTPGKLVIDSIVGGEVPKGRAILRSGAKPGDAIFVSGSLGGAAGGLILLESGKDTGIHSKSALNLIEHQLRPIPEVVLANSLQTQQLAASLIDTSDGLSSDLGHICRASGVGARIHADLLPVDPSLGADFPPETALEMALHGGEDLRLIFTGDKKKIVAARIDNISHIGEITANSGLIEVTRDGKTTVLDQKGYQHF
ncbi:MAG: thiamine-phosphate kinase [Pyrinomonadaceae bacterium]